MPDFYEDKELPCANPECPNGGTFVFTGGEQKFLRRLEAEGKLSSDGKPVVYTEPKRCAECRRAKKARYDRLARSSDAMGNEK